MSKHVAKVIHLVLKVISAEPIHAIQDELLGDCFRGSDEVVRRCFERSIIASAGGSIVVAPVSLRASVPFRLFFVDHGHH